MPLDILSMLLSLFLIIKYNAIANQTLSNQQRPLGKEKILPLDYFSLNTILKR